MLSSESCLESECTKYVFKWRDEITVGEGVRALEI